MLSELRRQQIVKYTYTFDNVESVVSQLILDLENESVTKFVFKDNKHRLPYSDSNLNHLIERTKVRLEGFLAMKDDISKLDYIVDTLSQTLNLLPSNSPKVQFTKLVDSLARAADSTKPLSARKFRKFGELMIGPSDFQEYSLISI